METAVLPTFIKFSQVVGWERPFCPQFIKFSQVVGWKFSQVVGGNGQKR
ncbi:MAG: hypothetical protein IPH82_26670 [Chloroflexi bacterium]|nr:hypothetical protein [Chloroflexota bacterium]